ncbi:hypothetical protein D0Z00_001229 [Geotrichum galactomycetum]|uniref:Uncharacterized protein n=1 Tax=Geotrichum galactomycetum TaxID=27317 RepID=A0ACB6V7H7_9ASCO|nr:hypothetical protein D0Z00_001229 [Geotrichum candidum]
MIEIPARGYLRGDSVQVTITVNHVKPVKSVHGVVVTLSRISRVCGGGLELQSFRKDLAQTVSSLITDPTTFSQTLSNKLRIPLDVFPTTTGHDMVSFQYCIEAVIDLAGKWNLKMTDDEMVGGGIGGGIGSSGGFSGFLGGGGGGGHGSSGRFIDTDKLKKNRGTVSLWMELVIGTERGVVLNANRRHPQPGQYLSHHYQHYQRRPQTQHESDQDLHHDQPQHQPQHQSQHQQELPSRHQHDQQQQYGYQPRHLAHASSGSNSINYHHAAPHAYNSQDNNNSLIMPGGSPIPPTAAYAGSAASSTPPISAEAEKERLRQEQEAAYLPSEPAPYAAAGSNGGGRGSSTLAVALPTAGAADPASALTEPSAPPLPDDATVEIAEAGTMVINSTTDLAAHHGSHPDSIYHPAQPQDPSQPGLVDKLERERLLLLDHSSQPYDVPTYVGPSPPLHNDSPIVGLAQYPHQQDPTEQMGLGSAPSLPLAPSGGGGSDEPSAPPLEHADLADLALHEYEHAPSEPSAPLAAAEFGGRPGSFRQYRTVAVEDAPSAPPAPAVPVESNSDKTTTIRYKYSGDGDVATAAPGPAFPSGTPTNVLETIERNRVEAAAAAAGSNGASRSHERDNSDDAESDSELYN